MRVLRPHEAPGAMPAYDRFLLGVYDGDQDAPIKHAARHLRHALRAGHVKCDRPVDAERPVVMTDLGIKYLVSVEAIPVGELAQK